VDDIRAKGQFQRVKPITRTDFDFDFFETRHYRGPDCMVPIPLEEAPLGVSDEPRPGELHLGQDELTVVVHNLVVNLCARLYGRTEVEVGDLDCFDGDGSRDLDRIPCPTTFFDIVDHDRV
jgi:hypothetical protein